VLTIRLSFATHARSGAVCLLQIGSGRAKCYQKEEFYRGVRLPALTTVR